MTDVHSHILFGIDDGAKNLEESILMLDAAKEAGFDKIIATPHVMKPGYDKTKAEESMEALRPYAEERGISLFQGYEYNCYALNDDGFEKALDYCTRGTKTILIEFKSSTGVPAGWDSIVRCFDREKASIIIAHPERYRQVQRDTGVVKRMIEMGCELQLDALSLDEPGLFNPVRKCAKKLLKEKMVSYVASDAHSPEDYKRIAELFKGYDEKFFYDPDDFSEYRKLLG